MTELGKIKEEKRREEKKRGEKREEKRRGEKKSEEKKRKETDEMRGKANLSLFFQDITLAFFKDLFDIAKAFNFLHQSPKKKSPVKNVT